MYRRITVFIIFCPVFAMIAGCGAITSNRMSIEELKEVPGTKIAAVNFPSTIDGIVLLSGKEIRFDEPGGTYDSRNKKISGFAGSDSIEIGVDSLAWIILKSRDLGGEHIYQVDPGGFVNKALETPWITNNNEQVQPSGMFEFRNSAAVYDSLNNKIRGTGKDGLLYEIDASEIYRVEPNLKTLGIRYRKNAAITECGLLAVASRSLTPNPFEESAIASAEMGLVHNLSRSYGLGGTIYIATGDDWRAGPKIRFRKWLNDDIAMDLSAGMTFNLPRRKVQDDVAGKPGLASGINIGYRDMFILLLEYDIYKTWNWAGASRESEGSAKSQRVLYVGIVGGSEAGKELMALSIAAIILTMISYSN